MKLQNFAAENSKKISGRRNHKFVLYILFKEFKQRKIVSLRYEMKKKVTLKAQ